MSRCPVGYTSSRNPHYGKPPFWPRTQVLNVGRPAAGSVGHPWRLLCLTSIFQQRGPTSALSQIAQRRPEPGRGRTKRAQGGKIKREPASASVAQTETRQQGLREAPPRQCVALPLPPHAAPLPHVTQHPGKSRADLLLASEWVPVGCRTRRWSRSSRTRRSMSDTLSSGGREAVARGLSRRQCG